MGMDNVELLIKCKSWDDEYDNQCDGEDLYNTPQWKWNIFLQLM